MNSFPILAAVDGRRGRGVNSDPDSLALDFDNRDRDTVPRQNDLLADFPAEHQHLPDSLDYFLVLSPWRRLPVSMPSATRVLPLFRPGAAGERVVTPFSKNLMGCQR